MRAEKFEADVDKVSLLGLHDSQPMFQVWTWQHATVKITSGKTCQPGKNWQTQLFPAEHLNIKKWQALHHLLKSTYSRGILVFVCVCVREIVIVTTPYPCNTRESYLIDAITHAERVHQRELSPGSFVVGKKALIQRLGGFPNPLWGRKCRSSSASELADHCPSSPCGMLGVVVLWSNAFSGVLEE